MKNATDFPIKLGSSRAWRTYLGGKLLDELYGSAEGEDGHFPEEWITSLVAARNAGREHIREEGMSHLAADEACTLKTVIEEDPEGYLGKNHVEKFGTTMGFLVKLIDSAERLTIQVHPDKEKAKELFQSDYGKTECWYILGGREIDGKKPCVYLGFRPGVTRERWNALFKEQDLEGMLKCLHRFEVKPGDTILIEGGVPHAIGAGCFLAEIQEPTDYTIRVERTTPSGYLMDDMMCHQGLGFEKMFECFHYMNLSEEETRKRWFKQEKAVAHSKEGCITQLIGYEDTSLFKMNMVEISGIMAMEQTKGCSGLYVLEGNGWIRSGSKRETLLKGDQLFVPAGTGMLIGEAAEGEALRMIQCYGPEIK